MNNELLKKYEIKPPDYDPVHRDYVGMEHDVYKPKRYKYINGQWYYSSKRKKIRNKNKTRIMFVGDITCFDKQFEEAQQGKGYDFSYEFEKVKPLFAQADLVVGNLETMIDPAAPYRSEKYVSEQNYYCNAPIEFLDALRKSGFDVLTNANNHDLDTGAAGIGTTIDYIERMGFIQTGTFKTDKKRYELINVNGFKIAVVAFATEHNKKRSNLTREGADFLLNDYSKERAAEIHKCAREEGAELVFVCIHWGKEHVLVQNKRQEVMAQELADIGYDCIIGSHPHVLQPFAMIQSGDRKVPVFYSMGNFVSHNVNTPKGRSVIACFDLERDNDYITLEASYIPIFTSKNYGKKKYVVLPIPGRAMDPRNKHKKNAIRKVLGKKLPVNKDVLFFESIERIERKEPEKFISKDQKIDFSKVTSYPVQYDDGSFLYAVYEKEAKVTGLSPNAQTTSFVIPDTVYNREVNGIRKGAFEQNTLIKKIRMNLNIKTVNERVYRNCTALEGVSMGRRVRIIKKEAFSGCTRLSAVVMRKGLKQIEEKAFKGCIDLRAVKIPANVTVIAADAFEGCTKAVFYCEPGSYAEQFAKEHGYPVVHMSLTD